MPTQRTRTIARRAGPVARGHAQQRSSQRNLSRHFRVTKAARIEPAGEPVRKEELEQPTSLLHRAQALANAAYPGKRRLTNAFDERVCKRRNTDSLFGTPWDEADNGLEKPGYESLLTQAAGYDHSPAGNPTGVHAFVAHLAHNVNDGRADVGITGNFGKLPTEVLEDIFKHVLVHDQPISVLRGWSLVYIRDRPRLEAQLLRVCRDFYEVGVQVLYGNNTFHYKNRDPPGSHRDTNAVVNKVFQTPGFTIPIDKYGHLFRNIHVSIEPNRMHTTEIRENVAKALQKFVPGHGLHRPARLRRVIVQVPLQTRGELKMKTTAAAGSRDVPSEDFFKRDSRVFQVLEKLNCQFIEVVGEPKRANGMYFRAVIDRRPHFTQQSVDAGHEDIWANDVVAIANRKREFATSEARFGLIGYWIKRMTLDPFRLLGPDALFQPYIPPVYTKPLHSIKTKYRNYKDKDGWSFMEHEAAVAGPSQPHGVVTRSRGHNVTMRTPITTYSASSETDIDEDAQNYAELDLDTSSSSDDDGSEFGDYDEEYMDAMVTNDD